LPQNYGTEEKRFCVPGHIEEIFQGAMDG